MTQGVGVGPVGPVNTSKDMSGVPGWYRNPMDSTTWYYEPPPKGGNYIWSYFDSEDEGYGGQWVPGIPNSGGDKTDTSPNLPSKPAYPMSAAMYDTTDVRPSYRKRYMRRWRVFGRKRYNRYFPYRR